MRFEHPASRIATIKLTLRMPLNCMILDDEPRNVQLLQHMLAEYCPQLNIVATETDARKRRGYHQRITTAIIISRCGNATPQWL